MTPLKGKTAVVTGAGSGIGLAIAQRFAGQGAAVVLVGRQLPRLEEAAKALGNGSRAVSADVSDPAQVKALFDSIDCVDLLVTCAGGVIFGKVDEVAPAEWRELFAGRFFGQLDACHYAVPKMPEGSVILLCSGVAGDSGLAEYAGGSALCGAVNAMGRSLAVELAPRGIRVNVLSPGIIDETDIKSNLDADRQAEQVEGLLGRIPAARPGVPGDVADAALFLATNDYTTGVVLNIDGGWAAT